MLENLVILAPGLLGGSVARAAHARGLARRITVWARRPEARLKLREQPWVQHVADTPEDAVREASLVVLAAPVDKIIELARLIAPHLPAGALVTDVGSVKGELCRACHTAIAGQAHFIGSHPMAGSEKTGWENATDTLFEKRVCFVTPLEGASESATATIARFWHDLGAEVTTVTPDQHDEITAHISHLPQAVATSLATFLAAKNPGWRNLSGNGLRDTTRIAASDATMWIEIFQQNRDEVLRALTKLEDELHGFKTALSNRDWPEVRARLERGKAWRDGFRP
ncbi:prephenate dehydrogenase [Rariglobus hedericola]|uniref:prephenate dehydrogenase n=1 Tax=Rariglobus hedericola TaxID=2597822 RepID=UPI0019394AE0|nr:prephenate dehydrogenase/arogenate dehydrogenase family protein [Rariglobus hedericola]